MSNLFYGCSTLTSLDLSKFTTSQVIDMNNMFYDCSNLKYINLRKLNIKTNVSIYNFFSLTPQNLMLCTENKNDILINLLGEKIIMFCDDNHKDKYNCYMKNSSLYNSYICDICQNNFTFNFSEFNNSYSYINCFKPKPVVCYNSCKICEIEGNETNNNCVECKEEFIYEFNITNPKYKNCYIDNPFKPPTTIVNIAYTSQLVKESTNYINYPAYTSELIIHEIKSTFIEKENKTEIIKNIISNLINEINLTETNSGNDKKVVEKDKVIIFTTTENQKNNSKDNYITMDLGPCENILKNHYHIPINNSLFILQIVSEEEGMKIPKIGYEVYYPLNNSMTKLDLTLCEGTKLEISISVDINGTLDLDLYNPKSEYYNELCVISTSESGTDIPLKDRRNEFVKNNLTLCEENCELVEYNKETKKVKCSCDMKPRINSNFDLKFDKNEFFKSFTDVKNIINLNIMRCFKEVLKIKGLKKNYGFLIMITILILYFITLSLFPKVSYKKLKKQIKKIIWALKFLEMPMHKNKLLNKPVIIRKKIKKKTNEKDIYKDNKKSKKEKTKRKLKIINFDEDISIHRLNPKEKIYDTDKKKLKKILKRKSFELNSLDYQDALKLDKRNFCQYYGSLLKYNHPFIFSFIPYNDYNSKIIRLFLFFFSFCIDLTINALFFTDEAMHKIHEEKGQFDFLFQIPQILYSSLISRFINYLIRKLALSQDAIVGLKQERKISKTTKKTLLRILKFKFILYFILSFVIIIFILYYITCFCGIYVNTQIHLIKDSLISLAISLLLPSVLFLIPGIFRITALRSEKPNRNIMYKFSSILEEFLG